MSTCLIKITLLNYSSRVIKTNQEESLNSQLEPGLFSDSDFWFPMNSCSSGPVPLCARGHTATYDPDSKTVYVYGGLREGQRYSELYILNTLTWKWKIVTVGLLGVTHIQIYSLLKHMGDYMKCSYFPPPHPLRLKEMCQIWLITLQYFTRKNSLSLEEFNQVLSQRIKPAAMHYTSSTQSMDSGTNPLWRAASLCLALGQPPFTKSCHLPKPELCVKPFLFSFFETPTH